MADDWREYSEDEIREQVLGRHAKFFQSEFNPQTGMKSITRYWRVSHAPVEQVRDFLYKFCDGDQIAETIEVEDPAVADGVRQSGTWKLTKIFELAEKPGNIYETLTQNIDGHELQNLSRNSCAYIVTRTYYWDVAEVQDAPQGTSGVVWSVENVTRDKETGLFSYVLEKRETLTLKMGAWVSEIDSSQHTDSTVWKGVREGDVDQNGNAITGLDNMSREKGKIKRENRTKNDDCTHDIKQDITEVVDQTGSGHEVRADETTDELTHTENPDELEAPAEVTGQIHEVSSRPTEAGNYQTTDRVRTAHDVQTNGGEDRADQTMDEESHTSNSSQEEVLVAGDGEMVSVDNRSTPFPGRFQTTKRTVTAHDIETSDNEDRADQSTEEVNHTYKTGQETEVTAGDGEAVSVSNQATQFKNRFRTTKRTVTAHDIETSDNEDRADQSTEEVNHTYKTGQETEVAAGDGEAVSVSNQATQFKNRFRTTKRTVTAHDIETSDNEDRADQSTEEENHTYKTGQETEVTAGDGEVVSVTNQATQFKNRFRTVKRTITAHDIETQDNEDRADQSTSEESHTSKTGQEAEVTAGDGEVVSVSNQATQFKNRFRTIKRTTTAHDIETSDNEDRADQTTVEENHTYKTGQETEVTAGDGEVVSVSNQATQFKNRYRTVKRTVTAHDIETTDTEERHDQSTEEENHTYKDGVEDDAEETVGAVVSVTNRPTQFKNRYQTVKRTVTGKPQEETITWTSGNGDNYLYAWWKNQQPGYGQTRVTAASSEYSVSASVRLNEFGLEDGDMRCYPDKNGNGGSDVIHIAAVRIACEDYIYNTTKETDANGIPVLVDWRLHRTWYECRQTVNTHAEAEDVIQHESTYGNGVAWFSISQYKLFSGLRQYLVEWKTPILHDGGWERLG